MGRFVDVRIAGASIVGVVAAMGAAGAPALAARPHAAMKIRGVASAHRMPERTTARPLASGVPQSSTVGGYIVAPAEGITSVSSTFRLPTKVSCPDPSASTILLGEDVPAGGGGDDAWAQVALGCSINGVMTVGSGGGNTVNANASPGDRIETRIVETPGGSTITTVDDLTNGQVISSTGATNSSDTQVILGAQDLPGGDGTIAQFTGVSFTGVQVGGLDWNQTVPAPSPYALDLNGAGAQIVPSKVPATPSSSFTLTEKKAS